MAELLLRLLLLLLLLLAAHPLQFLQELLGSLDAPVRRDLVCRDRRMRHDFSGGRIAGGRRSVILVFILLLLCDNGGLARCRWSIVADGKLQFARSAGIRAAEHEDVVAGTVEQLGEDLARIRRAIDAEDALVFRKPVDGHACVFGQLMEDVAQA